MLAAAVPLFAVLLSMALLTWMIRSETGSRVASEWASRWGGPSLVLEGWQGRLFDAWRLKRFELNLADMRIVVEGAEADWRFWPLLARDIQLSRLRAERVEIRIRPSADPKPLSLPQNLLLPLSIEADSAFIARLQVGDLSDGPTQAPPYVDLGEIDVAGLALRSDALSAERASAVTPFGRVQAQGRIETAAPFALDARASLQGRLEERSFSVTGQARGSLASLDASLLAEGDGLKGNAQLHLTPFEPLPLRRAQVKLSGLNPAAFNASAPQALLDIDADLTPELPAKGDARGPAQWRVRGPLSVRNTQPGPFDRQRIAVEALTAQLDWQAGVLRAEPLQAQVSGGGRVGGHLTWRPDNAGGFGRLDGRLNVTQVDLQKMVAALRPLRVSGALTAEVETAAQRFTLQLSGGDKRLDAAVHLRDGVLSLPRARLNAGQAEASATGKLGLRGQQAFEFSGTLKHVDPSAFLQSAPRGDLNAGVAVKGHLQPRWQVTAQLNMDEGRLGKFPLQGNLGGTVSPDRMQGVQGDLNLLGNTLNIRGDFGKPGDRLTFKLDAPALARLAEGYGGSLQAEGELRGSLAEPAGELQARLRQLRLPGDVRLAEANARLQLREGAGGAFSLAADMQSLLVGDDIRQGVPRAQLTVDGTRANHQASLDAVLGDPAARTPQQLLLRVSGGLVDGGWRGRVEQLEGKGQYAMALSAPASLNAGSAGVELGEADIRGEQVRIHLARTAWTPTRIEARGSFTGVEVGVSLDDERRTVMRGRSLRLGGEWDVTLGELANGQVRVFREGGDIVLQGDAPIALGLSELEVILAATDNRLALAASAEGRRIGVISATATATARRVGSAVRLDPDQPLLGAARIEVPNIDWVGPLVNQNLQTGGGVVGDFSLSGTPARPVSAGQVQGKALVVGLADQGLRLKDGEVVLAFDAQTLKLQTLAFSSECVHRPGDLRVAANALCAKPGRLSGEGTMALTTGEGRFDLRAERIGVMQRSDIWVLVSGDGRIDTTWEGAKLEARLASDAGFVGFARTGAPSLSDDVVIRGSKTAAGRKLRFEADVKFDFGERFLVRAYGVDAMLSGGLHIARADNGSLRANGSVRTREGVYDAYGQRLAIERGVVNFQGPLDNPGLNIVAKRTGLAVEAGVEVTGTAQRPRVRLVSEPNVPDSEKLSWILLGRGSDVGSQDAALLLSAAGVLFNDDGEGIKDKVARSFGFDDIIIGQSDSSMAGRPLSSSVATDATGTSAGRGGGDSDQAVAVGKRLTRDVYLSLEQNFIGTESIVKLTYNISRLFSLILRAGTDNAIDLNYSITFR